MPLCVYIYSPNILINMSTYVYYLNFSTTCFGSSADIGQPCHGMAFLVVSRLGRAESRFGFSADSPVRRDNITQHCICSVGGRKQRFGGYVFQMWSSRKSTESAQGASGSSGGFLDCTNFKIVPT